MSNYKTKIPKAFYNSKVPQREIPMAMCVEELIEHLKKLPGSLPLRMDMENCVKIVVSNISSKNPVVMFEGVSENEYFDDEEDYE